jgi:hypothetical protein
MITRREARRAFPIQLCAKHRRAREHDCAIFAESEDPEAKPVAEGRLSIVMERPKD